MSLTKCRGKIG